MMLSNTHVKGTGYVNFSLRSMSKNGTYWRPFITEVALKKNIFKKYIISTAQEKFTVQMQDGGNLFHAIFTRIMLEKNCLHDVYSNTIYVYFSTFSLEFQFFQIYNKN